MDVDFKTCAYCDYKSKLVELFVFKRPSRKEQPIEVCPGCQTKIDNYDNGYIYVLYFLLITTTLFFIYFRPESSSTWVLANLVTYIICSFFSLFLHELGHAIATFIQGGIVPKIVFGKGNLITQFEIKETEIEVRSNWSIGLTYLGFENKDGIQKRKYFLSIAAGPLVNLLVIIISLIYMYKQENFQDVTTGINIALLLVIVNSLMFISSILPKNSKNALGFDSDGKHLVDFFCNDFKKLNIFYRQYFLVYLQRLLSKRRFVKGLEISELALKKLPDDFYIKNIYGTFLIYNQKLEQAIELYEKEILILDSTENTVESRMILAFSHNNLSYSLYESNSPDSNKILYHAEIAFSIMPWEPSILQTYASALYRNEKHQQSITLFNRALTFEQSDFSRSKGIASLALSYAAINEKEKAMTLYEEAKNYGYSNSELDRLEQILITTK